MSEQTGNEARYRQVQARMDAMAAQRHAARQAAVTARRAAREAQLKTAVDKAVREALARTQLTEAAPVAGVPDTQSAPATEPAPKPLHAMSVAEFRQHAADSWTQVGASMGSPSWHSPQPMTISDYIERGGDR